jgi:hypothetical protein
MRGGENRPALMFVFRWASSWLLESVFGGRVICGCCVGVVSIRLLSYFESLVMDFSFTEMDFLD